MRTAAAGPGAAAGAVTAPAVATTVGEAEEVRRQRRIGWSSGRRGGRGTGGCSEGQGEHAEAAVTTVAVVATTAAAAAVGAAGMAIKGRFLPWVVVAGGR